MTKACSKESTVNVRSSDAVYAMFEEMTCISLDDINDSSKLRDAAGSSEPSTAHRQARTSSEPEHEHPPISEGFQPPDPQPPQQSRGSAKFREPPCTW